MLRIEFRNGSIETGALEIREDDAWVTLQKIARRKSEPVNCWIKIPRNPATLLRVAMELMRIAGSDDAPKSTDENQA